MEPETIPQHFLKVCGEVPDRVALRDKDRGVWNEVSWRCYREHVAETFYGLRALGLDRGDRVAILSENRPEWLYADLATESARAVALGIFANSTPDEVAYYLNKSRARFVFVEDQEQVDKVLAIRDQVSTLEKAIVLDLRGMRHYQDPILLPYDELCRVGRERALTEPDSFEQCVTEGCADDPAVLCWTSGTTGRPKGAVLTHRNMLAAARALMERNPLRPRDQVISYLPLPWVGERVTALYLHVLGRYQVNFPETMDMEVVSENMREIFPNMIIMVPRAWQGFCTSILIRVDKASWLKRLIYNAFMPLGLRRADLELARRTVPLWLRAATWLGELVLYQRIRDHLGLTYCRYAYASGAALGPDAFAFLRALRIPLITGYGQTETSSFVTVQSPGDVYHGTAGVPLAGFEVSISKDGEILVRGEAICREYFDDPEATTRVWRDGWYLTGDQGYLDDHGHLVVVDRQQDVLRTTSGEEFSLQYLENRLKFSPYIAEAVVVGGPGRPYVTALIQIDLESVGNWAQRRRIPYTTYHDLTQKAEVYQLVQREVDRANAKIDVPARIRAFRLLPKELDPDDGELTRTGKLRREIIVERFRDVVEAMYAEDTVLAAPPP